MLFNTFAEIIPAKSLGSVLLRTPLVDLDEYLEKYAINKLPSKFYELVDVYEARYTVADGAIELGVDVRNGKIFKICAGQQYKGKLFKTIYVGMPVQGAMKLEPRLYYGEAEELLLIKGVDGVSIDVPEIDPNPEDVSSMPISSICVYIPELLTIAAQQGNW